MSRVNPKCLFVVLATVVLQVAAYLLVFRSGSTTQGAAYGEASLETPVWVKEIAEPTMSLKEQLTRLSQILKKIENYSTLVSKYMERLGGPDVKKTDIDEGFVILRNNVASAWQQSLERGVSENYTPLWDLFSNFKGYWLHTLSVLRKLGLTKKDEKTVIDLHVEIRNDVEILMKVSQPTRKRILKSLSATLRQKIEQLQNPANCKEAKILLCRLTRMDCGFGCETHSLVNCLIEALMNQRTLLYVSRGWMYSRTGWEYAFLPPSKCTEEDATNAVAAANATGEERVIERRSRDTATWTGFSIPTQFASALEQYHAMPFVWWITQFVGYSMRLQPWLAEKLEEVSQEIKFKSPIVGVHVRRGDKLHGQGARHEVEEYMFHVERWFDQVRLKQSSVKPAVYLATEDPTVLPELKQKYPHYDFIGSKIATEKVTKKMRYGDGGLVGIIFDILFLSKCDYLVCTLSSSVCRTAFDMMTYANDDASTMIQTIDSGYRFKRMFRSNWRAKYDHIARKSNELELRVGDLVKVSMKQQDSYDDGFVFGENIRTEKRGRFPSYKAKETLNHLDFPILGNLTAA